MEPIHAALQHSKVFRGLDQASLDSICRRGQTASFAPEALVVEEGFPNHELFVVVEGTLEVFLPKTPERFSRVHVASLGPGDCIGEYSFIDDKPASASVVATEATQAFVISKGEFHDSLESDSAIGQTVYRNLLVLLIERLREGNRALDLFRPPDAGL